MNEINYDSYLTPGLESICLKSGESYVVNDNCEEIEIFIDEENNEILYMVTVDNHLLYFSIPEITGVVYSNGTGFNVSGYQERQYRSQLEARWAAMFDLLNWKFEYEPFTLGNWLVDFIIYGAKEILVEIKPSIDIYDFPLKKIFNATKNDSREILLLGPTIIQSEFGDPCFGWLNDREDGFEEKQVEIDCFSEAVANNFDGYGFYHMYNSWKDRITGIYDGNSTCRNPSYDEIISLWNKAGNEVMYRPIKI